MGALDGTRVIDFGQYMAGPLAGMLLADQGADVIRVEPPGGPLWKTPANATWNRGKRSITLDLKDPDDLRTARRLVASADVLIENFRPGVMARLGVGHDDMLPVNPRLIYCSLPGFGETDPRAGVAAWDGVVGAATGSFLPRAGNAVYTAIPTSSAYAAMVGAVSIAMALNARERDGVGQYIEVPLFDATFQAMGLRAQRVHSAAGTTPDRSAMPWVRQYECADGRWVQFHAANTRFVHQFIDAAGVGNWREQGLDNRQKLSENPELSKELLERMLTLFKTRTAQEWEDLVNAAGTPTAVCRDSAEWIQHPHAIESLAVVEVNDPELGPMKQPGIQVRLSETAGEIRGPAPAPGADADAILAELEQRQPTTSATPMAEVLAALQGVKVLDLCIILAGPTCGRTLGEFGADVIKIDNPNREGGVIFHADVNRGKRSILLDFNKPEAMEVFWKLVDEADVIVQNYRQGSIDKLGIDYESVAKRRPDIVYASLNAYGDIGPWATRPGWEQLAQATTGMQKRYGGDGQPVLQPFPVNDYGTGFMGAYGVALALLHKKKTGEGQHVRTALARTAVTLQSAIFHDYAGKTWDEPRGQDAIGEGPLQRIYQGNDGWFFLGATSDVLARLEHDAGLKGIRDLSGPELEAALEAQFADGNCADWVEKLNAAGAGAHVLVTVEDAMDSEVANQRGVSMTREVPGVGMMTHMAPGSYLSRSPIRPGQPASIPGADAESVLAQIGMLGDMRRLVESGALVTEGVPAR